MLRKIITLFVVFSFICTQSGLAAMITPDGKTDTTVISNGNVHDVYSGTVSGNTAFNSFSNFDVYGGNTANLHLPGAASNLVNLVHDKASQIDGVLNAYKNGAIGGNVFFLNPNGIVIGAGGVVNVGALTLVTPTREFMDGIITKDRGVNSAMAQAVLAGDVPLTHSGLVSVKGKINAADGVGIMAATVKHEGQINTNFSTESLVNVDENSLNNKVLVKDGRVIIAATDDFISSGSIIADGAGKAGADINITAGNNVALNGGTLISSSASGSANAGNIYIYGDNEAYFLPEALVKATAQYGDGGFIELSGKNLVSLEGGVFKAGSLYGSSGTVLIDPLIIALGHSFSTTDGTNINLTANDKIIINDKVTLSSVSSSKKSGDITLKAPKIEIGDNAIITAAEGLKDDNKTPSGFGAGNVTIEAKDNATIPWVKSAEAYVEIGDGVTITGKDVKITAEASAQLNYAGEDDSILDSILSVVGTGVDLIDNFGLVAGIAKHNIKAHVIIGEAATLTASNDLTIASKVSSDLSIMAPFMGVSVVYAENKTESMVSIGKQAVLKASNNIKVSSDILNYISASAIAMSTEALPLSKFDGAVAVANMYSSNKILIEEGASLTAGKGVDINAHTEKKMVVSSSASAFDDGLLAASVTYSHSDVKNDVKVNGQVISENGGININSSIDSLQNGSTSSAGVGNSTVTQFFVHTLLDAALGKLTELILKRSNKMAGKAHSDFGAAASVSYSTHTNTASAVIGNTADIQAKGDLNLTAKVEEKLIRQAANASVSSKNAGNPGSSPEPGAEGPSMPSTPDGYTKENGGAAAVAIADYNNNASAFIEDGTPVTENGITTGIAKIDAAGDINISSVFDLPYEITWHYIEGIGDITEKINANLGIQNGFINTWAMSTVSTNAGNEGGDEQGDFGFAGSFNMVDYNSDTKAYIGKNAQINQRKLYATTGDIDVFAKSYLSTINWAGNTGLTLAGTDAKKGIGASMVMVDYNNKTSAYVADGALVNAKGLDVSSELFKRDITMAVSGGKAESFGFNGTFNWVDSVSKTMAYIAANTKINLASALNIKAQDDTQIFNISGGVAKSENTGIGGSVALVDVARDTIAYIGEAEDKEGVTKPAEDSSSDITAGNVNVSAGQQGDIYAYSLAGAIKTKGENKDQGKDSQGGKYGIGLSGDVSINDADSNTLAYINGVKIKSSDIVLNAQEDTSINTVSGSASLVLGNEDATSVGFAGSVSVNDVNSRVSAFVKEAEISSDSLKASSQNTSDILAIAASGSVAPTGKNGVTIAGSVAINEIESDVSSFAQNTNIKAIKEEDLPNPDYKDEKETPDVPKTIKTYTPGDISFEAKDTSEMLVVAGGVSVAKTAGIGSSVGVNTINSSTSSYIKGGKIEGSGVSAKAVNASSILDVSGTVGAGLDGMAVAASIGVNTIDNETEAYISGAKVKAAGDVNISADNTAQMLAVAGAVGGGKDAGVGISTAVSTVKSATKGYIDNGSDISSSGNVSVTALSATETETAAAAGGAGGKAGVAGSVAVNNIKTDTLAYVKGSDIAALGSVKAAALSQNEINFYGGAIAGAGKVGIGGTVAVNSVSDNASAHVEDSSVETKGKTSLKNGKGEDVNGLIVESEVDDDINVWSINAGGAGTVGVAGSVTVSNINNKAHTNIKNSKINENLDSGYNANQSAYILAKNHVDVDVYGGAIGGGGTVGVGAVSDTVLIKNETKTTVDSSKIYANKDINILTDSLERYNAILVSGGLGIGAAGIAGNVVVIDVEGDNQAVVKAGTLKSGGHTKIEAVNNVEIGKNDGGPNAVAVGSAAGGMHAGVAGSVLVVNVDNKTKSNVLNTGIDAKGAVSVKAYAKQIVNSYLPTLGAAVEGGGIAASISVVNLDSETSASVAQDASGETKITSGQAGNNAILVKAESDSAIETVIATTGVGIIGAGIGAAVGVSKINGKTSSEIGSGSTITANKGEVAVIADNKRAINDLAVATGAGMAGVTGSVSAAVIGGNIDGDALSSSPDAQSLVEAELARNSLITKESFGRGQLLEGSDAENMAAFTTNVNSAFDASVKEDKGTTASVGSNVSLKSKKLLVNAKDTVTLFQNVGGVTGGAFAGVGASVAVGNINTSTKAFIGENSEIEVSDEVNVKAESAVKNSEALSIIGTLAPLGGAVGATVAVVNSSNNTEAYISDYTRVKDAAKLNVTADASSDIHAQTVGVGLGALAVGASVAHVNKKGDTMAYLKDTVTLGEEDKALGDINIKAKTNHVIFAEAEAGGGGIVSGTGTDAKTNISGKVHALTGKNNHIYAKKFDLTTDGNALAKAKNYGVSVALGSVGVSIADAKITLDNKAEVGQNNKVRASEVIIGAAQNKAETNISAMAAGGALLGGVGVDSDSKISGSVTAGVSKNADIRTSSTDGSDLISVMAASNTKQEVVSDLYNIGAVLSIGANLADVVADVATAAIFDEGITMGSTTIGIEASSNSELYAQGFAGNGGAVNVGGTAVTTDNTSSAKVIIGKDNMTLANNIAASKLNLKAVTGAKQDSAVSAVTAGLGGAIFLEAENDADLDAKVEVRGNTSLTANDLKLDAQNNFEKSKFDNNLKSGSGGIIDVNISHSKTNINADADVVLGNNAKLKTVKNSAGESSFLAQAFNNIKASDKAVLTSGGLVMIPVIKSHVKNNSNANINIYGASVETAGDAVFNAKSDGDISTNVNISVYGLSGIANGEAHSTSNINNNINLHSGADIYTLGGSILLGLNQPFGGTLAMLNNKAITDIYNRTGIPIDSGSEAKGILNLNSKVDVKKGAALKSAKDININIEKAKVDGEGTLNVRTAIDAIELAVKDGATAAVSNQNSYINVDGNLAAGVNNIFNITIRNKGTVENPDYVVEGDGLENTNYAITAENLANNLVDELLEYENLSTTYGLSDEIRGAYEAEVSRIKEELRALGLTELVEKYDENGNKIGYNEIAVKASDVRYITFDDIFAGRGGISFTADSLTGAGNLSTAGYAEVKMTNSSDLYVRLHDVIVSDTSKGDITFNDAIVGTVAEINTNNKGSANFASISSSANQDSPVIEIKNNFKLGTQAPYLEIIGDMENLGGTVDLFSEGSIYAKGNIKAEEIKIKSNKDIVQSYTEGFRHIGGDPKSQWSSLASYYENANNVSSASDTTSGAKGGLTSIIGNNIFISGRYLNINGTVQSGIADWNLNIGVDDLQLAGGYTPATAYTKYWNDIKANKAGTSELFALSSGYGNIPAFYNVLTKQIIVNDIVVEGGRLELYGHILNTGDKYGQLTVLDGYGRINIANESGYDLLVNNIYNDKEVEGVIKITDTAFYAYDSNNKKQFLVTEYTRKDGAIGMEQYYTGDQKLTVTGNGSTTSYYKPLSGQRYSWNTGTSQTYTETRKKNQREFWGMDWIVPDDNSYTKTFSDKITALLDNGEKMIFASPDGSFYSYGRTGPIEITREKMTDLRWTDTVGWWIFAVKEYHHLLEYKTGTITYNNHSVKADYNIGINFIGYDAPETNITTKNNMLLNGAISSSQGAVNLAARTGSIDALTNGVISAKNLNLTAGQSIGAGLALNTRVYGGVLNASAANGDISINVKEAKDANNNVYDVKVGKISAVNGDVSLNAQSNIVNAGASSEIKGNRVVLTSGYGAVGTIGDMVNIDANVLSAKAQGGINVKAKGDLGLDTVHSVTGDVNLDVQGNVTDANYEKEADSRTAQQLLNSWNELELFDQKYILKDEHGNFVTDNDGNYVYGEDSWTQDQLKFAVNASSLKNTIDTQYEVEAPNIIAKNVNIKAGGSVGSDMGSEIIDIRDYKNLSEDKKLLIASAEADNLIFSFEEVDGERVPVSVEVFKTEDLDIHASNSLKIDAGEYIYIGAEEDLKIDSLKAGAGKNINIYTKGGIYNVASSSGANIKGGELIIEAAGGAVGTKDKALVTDMSGKTLARAKEGIFLSAVGDMLVDTMLSDKEVVLSAAGDILNGAGAGLINIKAGGVQLNADNIGSAGEALGISINQAKAPQGEKLSVKADAAGDINIAGIGSDDLYVGDITAGGDITLSSDSSLHRAGDTKISADNVYLGYIEGDAGASDNRLAVEALEISADVFGNLYLLSDAASLKDIFTEDGDLDIKSIYSGLQTNVENLGSVDGNILVSVKNDMMVNGPVVSDNNTISLTAENNLLNKSGASGVYGSEVNLRAEQGTIGEENNKFALDSSKGAGIVNAAAYSHIYLSGLDSGLKIATIESLNGDVGLLMALNGSLEVLSLPEGKANIKGNNITLLAPSGYLGTADIPVVVRVNKSGGKINLLASDGIYMKNLDFDFFSDYVKNTNSGDIVLNIPTAHLRIEDLVKAGGFSVLMGANSKEGLITISGTEMRKLTMDPISTKLYGTAAARMFNYFKEVQPEKFNFEEQDWLTY